MPLPGTALERGQVLPAAPLEDLATGTTVSAWDLRGRRAAVVCLLHADCAPCTAFRTRIEGLAGEIKVTGARIVTAVPDENARARYLGEAELPVVLVADRHGGAWTSYAAWDHTFPELSEISDTLWHLATMCPECGVATWLDVDGGGGPA